MLCKGIISINYGPKIADCQPRAQTRGTDRSTQAGTTGKISRLYTPGGAPLFTAARTMKLRCPSVCSSP